MQHYRVRQERRMSFQPKEIVKRPRQRLDQAELDRMVLSHERFQAGRPGGQRAVLSYVDLLRVSLAKEPADLAIEVGRLFASYSRQWLVNQEIVIAEDQMDFGLERLRCGLCTVSFSCRFGCHYWNRANCFLKSSSVRYLL